jgi:hypothetical protein
MLATALFFIWDCFRGHVAPQKWNVFIVPIS